MATVDLVMPKMGESIMEATILKWHKHPGDAVKMDETILEIATDKVDTEVPSTAEGTISEILFNVNDVVPIGTVIARIKTGAEAETSEEPITTQPRADSYKPQAEATTHHEFAGSEVTTNYKPQTSNLVWLTINSQFLKVRQFQCQLKMLTQTKSFLHVF